MNNIVTLKKKYNYPIGFSDHSLGSTASVIALSLGATIFEKHFTLSKNYSRIVVICDARSPQSCFDKLAKEISPKNIFYPDILFISNQNVLSEDEAA